MDLYSFVCSGSYSTGKSHRGKHRYSHQDCKKFFHVVFLQIFYFFPGPPGELQFLQKFLFIFRQADGLSAQA